MSKLALISAHLALSAMGKTNQCICIERAKEVLRLARKHQAVWARFSNCTNGSLTQQDVEDKADNIILQIRRDVLRDDFRVEVRERCDPRYATVVLVTTENSKTNGDMFTSLP